jgi:hypothetical protein
MPGPELPHYDFPMRFVTDADGLVRFATVEQNTPDERQASAALIVSTPRGARMDDPVFGVTEVQWTLGAVDTARLAAEIEQSDPRLELETGEMVDLVEARVRNITVGPEA